MSDPIDAVYTWSDEDRLRYSLRSLERKAPWVRSIYLVTDGAAPAWVDRANGRLSVVTHQELFRDRSVLPTANLAAVEWHLYRIQTLARRFLYLHDDCFFGRSVTPDDFMTAKRGHRVFVDKADLQPSAAAEGLLNARFGNRTGRKKLLRAPRLLDRDFLEEIERLWVRQVRQTVSHRSPQADDVSLETLFSYYLLECPQQAGAHEAVALGERRKDYMRLELTSAGGAFFQLAGLAITRPKFFSVDYGDGKGLAANTARMFLKSWFRRRSSFERTS